MLYTDASIIFDLDGTLVDTAPDLLAATNHIMDHIGCPKVTQDIIHPVVSKGAKAMMAQAAKAGGAVLSDSMLHELTPTFIDFYNDNIAGKSRPYPYLLDNLKAIHSSGGIMGVCTNKKEHLAVRLLDELNLSSFFAAIVGADTLEVRKPHPGHLLGTIERINGNPQKAIMIGDSAPDIKAAQAANIPVIAVSFGYSDTPVETLKPDAIIHSYDQFPELLSSFLGN